MSEYVDFHYMPLEGKITGKQVLKQTEDAINDIGEKVYSLNIDSSLIDEAIETSETALNIANSALSAVTTGRSVWFNNVADMVESASEIGVVAETKGYYLVNDGGGAVYIIRQKTGGDVVDGGSIIQLADEDMVAQLVADGEVNVKQFGAKGNGVDDDSTAFQNTSTYAQTNGFTAFVTLGTYNVTETITGTFNSFGEVTIVGGGTVDIVNLHDVVDDVTAIKEEVESSTASAQASAENASDSAESAANSATSAGTTLSQLIAYLDTKEEITAPIVDPTLTISGAAADAKVVGEVAGEIRDKLNSIVSNDGDFTKYFYKANTYVNNSGVETTLNGYDLYKIPCVDGQIIEISWADLNETPWNGMSDIYAVKVFYNDNTFSQILSAASSYIGVCYPTKKVAFLLPDTNTSYITFSVKNGNESGVRINIDVPYQKVQAENIVEKEKTVYTLTNQNSIESVCYIAGSSTYYSLLSSGYNCLWHKVKKDDVIYFQGLKGALTWRANYFNSSTRSYAQIGYGNTSSFTYTVPADGIICALKQSADVGDFVLNPYEQIKIDSKNVINSVGGQYVGKNGVAFGTSLTYRSQTTGGYLQFLPGLCGATIDNQGIGSSTILNGAILNAVKNYASYADKDFVILEGFVNDWYQNNVLGTYTDDTETTVCGCVRSAINHMLTQNPNMTIFLVLDHYGRLYSGTDCSSTAENASNLTQYQYYEEIAKVAESMSAIVIKEYALSGISENTPQFLLDNIHLNNGIGAEQSANTIWSVMRNCFLKVK